jgi:hypothetical protein
MPQANRQHVRHARGRRGLLWSIAAALLGHALVLVGIGEMVTRNALDPGLSVDPMDLAQLADVLMPVLPDVETGVVLEKVAAPADDPPLNTPHVAEQDLNPDRETVKRTNDPRGQAAAPPIDEPTGPGPAAAAHSDPAPAEPEPVVPRPLVTDLPRVADPVPALPVPVMPDPAPVPSRGPGTGTSSLPRPDESPPLLARAAPPPPAAPGVPGSPPEEAVPNIETGDETAVKARASARARYQNIIRDRVQKVWRAQEMYKQAAARGMIDGRALESLVMLRLRGDGTVERADLHTGSGIGPLDHEAVAVFGRATPFEAPPPEILDERGGLQFPVRLTVIENVTTFQQQTRRAIRERWRPSPAFSRAGDRERITVAKVLLTAQGVLARAQLVSSAGIDFLDTGAMAALAAGLRLPDPPDDYVPVAGLVPLLIEFRHTVRRPGVRAPPPDVRVLNPKEQPSVR